ncbi:type II secretion system protein GspE [Sphingorhabdus sp. IMCC26285]|uniref:Type II secretion system protein GspE n=1 Tax=Sphingorhabdus profundilacus TaxID=2509718 RepID=A0A6I4LWR3_9SPHN|nr:ATPase, T2SS/T4P/T4SS family [Sphingorhabdus profundilacus]MVZ96583.1 type II secretion system protein GspE [Sphingorhabdus profundilacus]
MSGIATLSATSSGLVTAADPSHITIESVIENAGLLSEEASARLRLAVQESGERFDVVMTRLGLISEAAMQQKLAEHTGLDVAHPADFPHQAIGADILSPAFLRDNRVLPLKVSETSILVALVDPFDSFVQQSLGFVFAKSVEVMLARASDIDAAIDRLYGSVVANDEIDSFADDDDIERLKDLVSDAPVIRAVNRLIAAASDARASDIHIEPTEDRLAIRFRIDGVLQDREPLSAAMRGPFVSRIKVMAGLNIAERRLPQDGRLRIAVRGHDIDLRVATAPAIHGESVVMRILDRSKLALDFISLGFDAELTAQLRAAVNRPYGIVLVTGPTGSGKTTTLYAALAELNTSSRKLLTVEDPIEYRLPGVIQTQVNPQIGFTFGSALRSFLRLDPDIMMVGEIRDTETAQIAVQAALTGHMILSTLHTNSAAGAVTRLIDMEVEPFLLSSVLSGILAQRLVRKLCPHCRESYSAPPELLLDLGLPHDEHVVFYRAKGCESCDGSGYSGRTTLLEFLTIDDRISKLILKRADTREIADAAMAANMRTLRSDGLAKARSGIIAIEEAVRVTVGD